MEVDHQRAPYSKIHRDCMPWAYSLICWHLRSNDFKVVDFASKVFAFNSQVVDFNSKVVDFDFKLVDFNSNLNDFQSKLFVWF
jgi:hypothetical protein